MHFFSFKYLLLSHGVAMATALILARIWPLVKHIEFAMNHAGDLRDLTTLLYTSILQFYVVLLHINIDMARFL